MKKQLLTVFASVFMLCQTQAQTDKLWSTHKGKDVITSKNVERSSFPADFQLYQLNITAMKQILSHAQDRFASKNGVIISLPNMQGKLEQFEVFEASNFAPELQAQFPDIRAYAGRSLEDNYAELRMSISPQGIQTMVFRTDTKNEFMEPYSTDGTVYAVYNSSRTKGSMPFTCLTEDKVMAESLNKQVSQERSSNPQLLTFRLALSCNGEYTTYHGGTVAAALAAMNATMTRVNGVFEKDLTIHMNIIANNTAVIFTNAATDPYSTTLSQWNVQLQNTLTNTAGIGNGAYDIGHMFGATGGGGNAGCIGCVCVDDTASTTDKNKGSGITSPADGNPMGDTFDIDYVAHEMGHQFGGNHTFSNSVEGSGVNVEPGSGSTIMGYAGITSQDVQQNSDDYFVYATIQQIQNNMVNKTCPVRTNLTNGAPVVNAGLDFTIPKSTPFILTGTATDPNGNPMTYCWEQNDSATSQTGAASAASDTKTGGPNWRSYTAVSSPSRYFPPLDGVIANLSTTDGSEITVEALSSVARTMNFVLTSRDNVVGQGLTGTDGTTITVNATAGPFLVSSPNTNVSWGAGTNQSVAWDVAGTTANGVNALYVDILLSTDGGNTYPFTLANKVPNDGAETVTVPNSPGSANRIMVRGYNHIFYDLSNTNFTISASTPMFAVAENGLQTKSVCPGSTSSVAYNIDYTALSGFSGSTSFSATGNPGGSIVTFSPSTTSTNGSVLMTISNISTSPSGFYSIIVNATSGATTKTVPFYLGLGVNTVSLTSPANLALGQNTSVNLTWAPNFNATSYDVEVATNNTFTNIISSGTVTGATYTVTGLTQATNYYWRVMPKNATCGNGTFGAPYKFTTGQINCNSTSSANVPLTIGTTANVTINSTLNIPAGATISDVNITMNVSHTWINDLTATLISPSGTQVQIYAQPCISANIQNIVATFDDSGSAVVCGTNPGISGTVLPAQALSAFNGESSTGTWTLRILDSYNGDGGSLNSWSLNICSSQSVLSVNENGLADFALYPNPNKGNFTVQFNSKSNNDVNITVHDMRGRTILSNKYNNTGLFSQNLQLDHVQTGVYLVTVQDGDNKVVKRIIVE